MECKIRDGIFFFVNKSDNYSVGWAEWATLTALGSYWRPCTFSHCTTLPRCPASCPEINIGWALNLLFHKVSLHTGIRVGIHSYFYRLPVLFFQFRIVILVSPLATLKLPSVVAWCSGAGLAPPTLGDFRNISTISVFLLAVAPYNFYNFDTKMV